jgi:hypothetical protein
MLGGCENPASDGKNEVPEEPGVTPDPNQDPRTAQVSFAYTKDNSSGAYFDLDAWTVEETAEQWRIAVIEQGSVCFAVRKAPGQSIALGGPSAQWVSPTPEGEETDGSVAGAEIALFTVDTAQILDGGERTFTLTITEPDKEPGTVQVSLEVEADLTQGVGVFFTGADGRLTRITPENAETFANEYYVRDKEAGFTRQSSGYGKWWCIDFGEVDSLFDALIWVDQYAKSGTAERFQEYRIRVEKDEAIIPSTLTCGAFNTTDRADYVCFTLWGYKQERTITRDSFSTPTHSIHYSLAGGGRVFIGVGGYEEDINHIALRLGANITIDAQSERYPGWPGTDAGWEDHILQIMPGSIVSLEKGSKLTNHSGGAVWMPSPGGTPPRQGVLEMKGGAITNCGYAIALVSAGEYADALGYPTKAFRFHSGAITGNDEDNLILISSPSSRLPYTYFAVNE